MEKIAIIGVGYVGLVTGTCLAELGNHVTCIDLDASKIDALNQGNAPIYEPNLDTHIQKNLEEKRLTFSTDLTTALISHDIIIVCVGTPMDDDGSADMSDYFNGLRSIAEFIKNTRPVSRKIIVNKSTVPVGTGKKAELFLLENGVYLSEFSIVSNPEFLREGSAVHDFFHPDRIIIGGNDTDSVKRVQSIYRSLYRSRNPIMLTSIEAAELTKYAANAFLATKISFINEIANLCDTLNIDVSQVTKGIGADNRIGRYFLHPGPGYGGACFPKDTQALAFIGKENGVELKIVNAAIEINNRQVHIIVEKIRALTGNLAGKHIGLLGLSFKPETDDIRNAPALALIDQLLAEGCTICAYDPVAMPNTQAEIGDRVQYGKDPYHAVSDTNAVVLMTEWNQFRLLDLQKLADSVREKNFVDARNVYEVSSMHEHGFTYRGVGRHSSDGDQTVHLEDIEVSYGGLSDF
ncbi:UDP-glucose 6-dehydrogenase [bacterium]|nr:UDP-glucose 6-dehydrogenase [bacterium]|tara:strand:- start:2708 stop:4099 length:1392 start_codon:yes stop_codon:yes gene_type:complete